MTQGLIRNCRQEHCRTGFSLVEVVLSLGVISFAIVAILGVFPIGLQTSHSAQDETRAPQIAQSIFGSLVAQNLKCDALGQVVVPQQLNDSAKIPSVTNPVNLAASNQFNLYADNSGQISDSATGATYAISVSVNDSPTGFDPGYGSQINIRIAWPANAAVQNQSVREYIRLITKY